MRHPDRDFPQRRSGVRPGRRGPIRGQRPALERLEDRQLMTSSLLGISFPLSPAPTEGTSFTGVIAKFTDADKNTDPGRYAASIHWGDGNVSRGTIAADPGGGFDVFGTHTFATSGVFRITAQIGDTDGDMASVSTSNVVAQAPLIAIGAPVRPTRNGVVPTTAVAVFIDGDHQLKASAFTATIDWGDGQTSTGTIVEDRTMTFFKVLGSHRYRRPGSFAINVTVRQGPAGVISFFSESDLISNGAIAADHIDPLFVTPWGLAVPGPANLWDANTGTGSSTVFSSVGNVSTALPDVNIPAPPGATGLSTPTGVVNNTTSGFVVSDGTKSGPAAFIFDTEDGTISGWSPQVATNGAPPPSVHAVLVVDNSASGAVYKGLALLNVPAGGPLAAGSYLFAANFHSGNIDVFDSTFKPVTVPLGAFQDPTIPAGFAPFGIQTIGGKLYVSYAMQDAAKHDDVAGPGNGFVDVFSPSGALLQRLGGTGVQAELNSPWGLVQAPSNFGLFSNDILVGNFGDSHISAFDPFTGAFLGQLTDANGQPIVLAGGITGPDTKGLLALFGFGPGTGGNTASTLSFTSGFNNEADGVYGSLTPTVVSTSTASTHVNVTVGRSKSH
jgi:uncharacterized protein (TIGR03118 family)